MTKKIKLQMAADRIMLNPVMAHIRKVVYSPVQVFNNFKENEEKKEAADEKRLRKQRRNIQNGQHFTQHSK